MRVDLGEMKEGCRLGAAPLPRSFWRYWCERFECNRQTGTLLVWRLVSSENVRTGQKVVGYFVWRLLTALEDQSDFFTENDG